MRCLLSIRFKNFPPEPICILYPPHPYWEWLLPHSDTLTIKMTDGCVELWMCINCSALVNYPCCAATLSPDVFFCRVFGGNYEDWLIIFPQRSALNKAPLNHFRLRETASNKRGCTADGEGEKVRKKDLKAELALGRLCISQTGWPQVCFCMNGELLKCVFSRNLNGTANSM